MQQSFLVKFSQSIIDYKSLEGFEMIFSFFSSNTFELLLLRRIVHSSKEMMAEMENLRAEKVSLEESSKLAEKKFDDELAELKAQIGTLQSQV